MEWPGLEAIMALARGRCALLEGRLEVAERELLEACRLHERWPCLMLIGEPRTTLAFLRLDQGDAGTAWAVFAPVWQEAIKEDALGALLVEPAQRLDRLLATMPAEQRQNPETQALLVRLAAWKQAPDRARELASETASVLARLTDREREVLARIAAGDSNKLIARSLDLSPHTVKRHVANILGKLNVETRSAAGLGAVPATVNLPGRAAEEPSPPPEATAPRMAPRARFDRARGSQYFPHRHRPSITRENLNGRSSRASSAT
jgi:LuxR family maltose regulon positive regulatory protein